jgi:hypothetical protein
LHRNADESVDIYFGLKPPPGQDGNWIPTRAGGHFEVLFRLYGPDKPPFDKHGFSPISCLPLPTEDGPR